MIDTTNPEKRELARLVNQLIHTLRHECDGETEPCASIHRADRELQGFLTDHDNWKGDLSTADLGELVNEALSCSCGLWVERPGTRNHEANCDMWDPKADEFVQVSPPV